MVASGDIIATETLYITPDGEVTTREGDGYRLLCTEGAILRAEDALRYGIEMNPDRSMAEALIEQNEINRATHRGGTVLASGGARAFLDPDGRPMTEAEAARATAEAQNVTHAGANPRANRATATDEGSIGTGGSDGREGTVRRARPAPAVDRSAAKGAARANRASTATDEANKGDGQRTDQDPPGGGDANPNP